MGMLSTSNFLKRTAPTTGQVLGLEGNSDGNFHGITWGTAVGYEPVCTSMILVRVRKTMTRREGEKAKRNNGYHK